MLFALFDVFRHSLDELGLNQADLFFGLGLYNINGFVVIRCSRCLMNV